MLSHTSNKQLKAKFLKYFFSMAISKIMKYIVISLTKDMQDLYPENFKTPLRETKEIYMWKEIQS